jgi:hypothetical protein
MLFNDHVVATLAQLMRAPVPDVALICIGKGLIEANPNSSEGMGHLLAGIAHGSKFCDGLGDRDNEFKYIDRNKSRFASILVLHAWTLCNDRHFLYQAQQPFNVYSVDHGNYFAGGPHWISDDLDPGDPATVPNDLIQSCHLDADALLAACLPLQDIDERHIAKALAAPPEEWGVSLNERVALGKYLRKRQLQLLAAYGASQGQTAIEASPRLPA